MKWIKVFIYSAGAILLAAALARFFIAAGNAQVLALPEPMLGIPIRLAVLIVGGLELASALICLFGNRVGFQIGWLAWMATDFIGYRIGLIAMHVHPQVTCLGSITDPLRFAHGVTGFTIGLMPYYLLIGTCAAAFSLWVEGRKPQTAAKLKMFCASCGGKIEFAAQNVGRKIPCPLCKAPLILRRPENLKMSCGFCQEHIEFPSHAFGQKISCPHCKNGITLKDTA